MVTVASDSDFFHSQIFPFFFCMRSRLAKQSTRTLWKKKERLQASHLERISGDHMLLGVRGSPASWCSRSVRIGLNMIYLFTR